jgi:hypothetical protein
MSAALAAIAKFVANSRPAKKHRNDLIVPTLSGRRRWPMLSHCRRLERLTAAFDGIMEHGHFPASCRSRKHSMVPIHEYDALLMLATALAGKRRAAQLSEIMAAADLLQCIPRDSSFTEAFNRLSRCGLIREAEGRILLTADGEKIVAGLPAKADTKQRLAVINDNLYAYKLTGEHVPIVVTSTQFKTAIAAHRASGKGAGKNLAMPKVEADRYFKVEGRWRKVPGNERGKN